MIKLRLYGLAFALGIFKTSTIWGGQVVISRILAEPNLGHPAVVEIYNITSNPLDIAGWRLAGGVRFRFPDFSADQPQASFLMPFERLVLSSVGSNPTREVYRIPASVRVFGPWNGKLKPGERLALEDKNGVTICSVNPGRNWPWPVPATMSGQGLALVDAQRAADDWRNWIVTSPATTLPGIPRTRQEDSWVASPEIEANRGRVLVDYDALWGLQDSGQNLGPEWKTERFDASRWRRGPGLLGFDTKPLPGPGLKTPLRNGRQITYYFRHTFQFPGQLQPGDRLILDQILDDGAIYYLNGKELVRSRMPAGFAGFATLATSTVPTASEELNAFALDPNLLVNGENLLAVEVHQCSVNSSDLIFGMRLRLVSSVPAGFVINELAGDSAKGFVEICNTAGDSRNLKGCFISDQPGALRQFEVTQDRVVPPGGLVGFSLAEIGIHSREPLTVYLIAADGRTVLNAVTANFAQDGRSLGRSPDGGNRWFRWAESSRGMPNRVSSLPGAGESSSNPGQGEEQFFGNVIINELMVDPPFGREGSEYIELFNRGTTPMDLSGWRFDQGVELTFSQGTIIAPGGYLVAVANAVRFRKFYGDLPVAGEFTGKLRHQGELLRLVDGVGRVQDSVDFKTGGDWPSLVRGGGSSLELIHPEMENNQSSAWRDSREDGKATWGQYACTNIYLEQNPIGAPTDFRELHLFLVGPGHVALRQVGLLKNGRNFLDRPDGMATDGNSAHGWVAQGTHAGSYMTNGELHLVSDGRGDNRADRVEIDCVRLRQGESYELRFEGRWISGCPRLIAQTWDRSIGSSFLLALPSALGTPSRRNSVAAEEPLPQLDHLAHRPAVPRPGETVRVSVEVASRKALSWVQVVHRLDNASGDAHWLRTPMVASAEVGADRALYSADLTAHSSNGQVVQFYVEAEGKAGGLVTIPRDGAARPALYVVDDRKIAQDGRIDRFVLSAYDLESMREGNTAKYGFRQPRLSNHRYNMTFISNEESAFYGGSIRVSGSPFTRGRDLGKGKWELPADRPFRGRTKFYFDNDSNFHNRLCRYLLYQLGHVAGEAEWIRVAINSSGAFLKEDTEPVSNEFLERVFPNGRQGELYRFDDEWWFTDSWERNNRDADWLYKGNDDPLFYRTEWQKHTREVADDFSALIGFFKLYSGGQYSQSQIEQFLNADAVMQMAAVRGYIGDWDSFTMFRGKNGYFYRRPDTGRFQFLQWDSDLAFRSPNYPFYSERVAPWLEQTYNFPRFKKMLLELARVTESPQLETWLALEATASPERPVNVEFYKSFFRQRNLFLRMTGGSAH